MKNNPIVLFSLAVVLFASSAMAMEIPKGLKTNIESGEFKENVYAKLTMLIVNEWWNSEEDEEKTLISASLDYQEPEHADEPPEKVVFSYGIWSLATRSFITELKAYSIKSSAPFAIKWDMRDKDGKTAPDGLYRVIMNVRGEHYGELLKSGVFPVYVTTGGPTLENESISARLGVIEYGGAPEIRFTTKNINTVVVSDCDNDDNVLNRWEKVLLAGTHTIKSDLLDSDGNPFKPGKYATRITVSNPYGEDKERIFRYTLNKGEPLDVSVKIHSGKEIQVDKNTTVGFTVTTNQDARVVVQHISDGGDKNYIWVSTPETPEVLLPKGKYDKPWNRRPNSGQDSHYIRGTHRIRVTATSLSGEKTVVESNSVTLKPKPVEKAGPPNITLDLSPDYLVMGGRMQTTIRYSLDSDAHVYLSLRDANSGELLKDIVYRTLKKGRYSTEFSADRLGEGNYLIQLEVRNNVGARTIQKILSLGWRRRK